MNIYFVKATYTNNVYKLSDFYTGDNYIQNAMKMLSMVFKADDGVSSLIVPNKLPDNTDVRDYTHIMIPELKKIYRIVACDYWNTDQYQLTLDDDPLIANYVELKSKNIILNRTNDTTLFKGVHDLSELMFRKKQSIETTELKPAVRLGKFALMFFQADVANLQLDFVFAAQPTEGRETFANFAALINIYPEVQSYFPNSISYFEKEVYVSDVNKVYQCVIVDNNALKQLRWVTMPSYTATYTDDVNDAKIRYLSNISDVNVRVIALPIRRDIYFSGFPMPSYLDLRTFNITEKLIDIKIVDDLFLPFSSFTFTYDSVNKTNVAAFNGGYKIVDGSYSYTILNRLKNEIDLSRTELTSYDSFAPFKKYYLQVYGQRFLISPRYFNGLRMYFNLTGGTVNYVIFNTFKNNIIGSGSFTHQAKWYVDQLQRFYELNPTYKEQFFLKMATDSMRTIAGGAIGGSAIPGIGTAMGAVSGLGAAALDAGLGYVNLLMQEKNLKAQPDQINGNNSDLPLQLENMFGIFWIVEEPNEAMDGTTQMNNEYFVRGFPTSYVTSLNSLTARANDIFGTCKLVYGEIKEVVKNEYVTGYINARLKNGVVFI